jgi:hypothetical protein
MSQALRDERGWFLPGNKIGRQFTDEEIDRLVDEYCQHRSRGMDKQSFAPCDYRTIESVASALQTEKIREAESQGWKVWEEILRLVALGQNVTLPDGTEILAEKCNPTLLIFTIKSKMRGVYGDKVEQAVKVEEPDPIDYTLLSEAALNEIANARIAPRQGSR